MQQRNTQMALSFIRIVASLLIAIHGWHRLMGGGVADLGEAIARHFPMGAFLGWAVTLFEAVGAPLFAAGSRIAAGRLIFPLSLTYITIYVTSICIYHFPHGWFTSGTDADGCEYPVLLIAAFSSVAIAHMPRRLTSLLSRSRKRAAGHELAS